MRLKHSHCLEEIPEKVSLQSNAKEAWKDNWLFVPILFFLQYINSGPRSSAKLEEGGSPALVCSQMNPEKGIPSASSAPAQFPLRGEVK